MCRDSVTLTLIPNVILLTNETGIHSSVIVMGKGIEDAASLDLKGLVHNSFHHSRHLLVAQLVPCITWK